MLLVFGGVALALALMAVVANLSALYIARRNLVSAADGAAVAAAQRIDLAAFYQGSGPSDAVPIDLAAAQSELADVLPAGVRLRAVRLVDGGGTVVVELVRRTRVPFDLFGAVDPVTVEATARARTPLRP
jgi:uncharacterized membrane protein